MQVHKLSRYYPNHLLSALAHMPPQTESCIRFTNNHMIIYQYKIYIINHTHWILMKDYNMNIRGQERQSSPAS